MPSWLVDTFTIVNTCLLIINLILLLLILSYWEREKRKTRGGEKRNWSWYNKPLSSYKEHLVARDEFKRTKT